MMSTSFIAEVSSNHNGNLDTCLRFVETAAKIGCDAVKFQLFRIDSLFAPEILSRSSKHRARKEWELPVEFLPHIFNACREAGIKFYCTPFDLQGVEELAPYVDSYKIASYELTWPALLDVCGASGKPVLLSTGMATAEECTKAATRLKQAGCSDITLLHCVSNYPTQPEEANLSSIATLRDLCGCPVGWSDHSVNNGVICQAIFGFNASTVEFHIDLDGTGAEFSAGHCWLPEAAANMIKMVRDGEKAKGNGIKIPSKREEPERRWRADPEDGLRPFKEVRAGYLGDSKTT